MFKLHNLNAFPRKCLFPILYFSRIDINKLQHIYSNMNVAMPPLNIQHVQLATWNLRRVLAHGDMW